MTESSSSNMKIRSTPILLRGNDEKGVTKIHLSDEILNRQFQIAETF